MKPEQLLVIGRGSFLAREFVSSARMLAVRVISHVEADDAMHYEGARSVVNFAFAPELHETSYRQALDVDDKAARHAARTGAHYVMISSRRVYQPGVQWNASESAEARGADAYGRNKLRIERNLADRLGERLTVLRPGNVVGYEPIQGRRRFGAYLQNQLRDKGEIRLTVDPRTRRDLVPIDFFCRVLLAVVLRPAAGTFNVGSGSATPVGDAARWLIEGFGAGTLVVERGHVEDEFQLDSSALARTFGLACEPQGVERTLRDAGRRLALEAKGGTHGR